MNNYDRDLTYYSSMYKQNFASTSGYYNTLRAPYMQSRPHINPNFQSKYKQQNPEESLPSNKVLINPHFRSNVYVNPNFLPPQSNVATNVYVNPKILSESTIKNINLVQNKSNPSSSTVIPKNVQTPKISPTTTRVSKYKLVRNIPSVKLSKYKLIRSPLKTIIIKTPNRIGSVSKFKLDRRSPKIIRKLPVKVVKTSLTPTSNRLVNIGGTLYKTNRNKLQRTGTTTVDLPKDRVKKVSVTKINTRFRYVGQTEVKKLVKASPRLRRVSLRLNAVKLSSRFKLIYKNKTPINRKVKISSRKIKSASKYRKNNIPCPLFIQRGKCPSHDKGTCRRLHDPKMISICKKFLQGECNIENCMLSHNVSLEKMPTCKFYLNGFCSRQVCPYLHVKLSDAAEICRNFLNGFCAAADKCDKRHIYMCPEMDRTGKCAKPKCSYPHNSAVGKKSLIFKTPKSCKKTKKTSKITLPDKTETDLYFTDTQAIDDNDNAQTVRYFIKNSDDVEESQFSMKSDLTCDYFKESCPDFIPFI